MSAHSTHSEVVVFVDGSEEASTQIDGPDEGVWVVSAHRSSQHAENQVLTLREDSYEAAVNDAVSLVSSALSENLDPSRWGVRLICGDQQRMIRVGLAEWEDPSGWETPQQATASAREWLLLTR